AGDIGHPPQNQLPGFSLVVLKSGSAMFDQRYIPQSLRGFFGCWSHCNGSLVFICKELYATERTKTTGVSIYFYNLCCLTRFVGLLRLELLPDGHQSEFTGRTELYLETKPKREPDCPFDFNAT